MQILDIILRWLIPTVLAAFFGFLAKEIRDNKKSNEAMKQSMILMLRSQIVGKVETYTSKGFMPDYARACLNDLFVQYKALGGNHGVDILVNEAFKLPLQKKGNDKK